MSGTQVNGDPDVIEGLARSIEQMLTAVAESVGGAGGRLKDAEGWNDSKHQEICAAYDEAAEAAMRSLEPIASELVPRMYTIAQKLREASEA